MFDLRPHQEAAIAKMHNGCILCGGVGVGKSHTAVGYYLQNEAPKPVYVITTAKKRDKGDWQWLWGEVGMHSDPDLTMGSTVVVDSWNNIDKHKEVTDAFFIFDEQRLVGTGAWVKAFYKIAAANRWIMLSATPGDNWLDFVPVFRANGFIKNITQFKEDFVLSRWTGKYYQVTGYRQQGKLQAWRKQLLVDMPYERHTTRHTHEVAVEYDKDLVKELVKKRWHVYENRPLTDASELFRVMRKVVYSHDSRLTAVRGLLTKHPKLIVFYNFDYELEMLRTLSSGQTPKVISTTNTGESPTSQPQVLNPSRKAESPIQSGQQTKNSIETNTSGSPNDLQQDLSTHSRMGPNWDYLLSPEGIRANESLYQLRKSESTSSLSGSQCDGKSLSTTFTPTHMSTESLRQHDCSQESQKETECPENQSRPLVSRTLEPSESASDISHFKSDTGELESSPRRNTGKTSSRPSSESQDLSSNGRRSTPSPQFQVAEWNGHKHEEVPTTTSWVYLVQYVAGSEAWECTDTDAICFYSPPYSWKKWDQAHGRIDRLNTSFLDLHYFVLKSEAIIDRGVFASLENQRDFNEAAFRADLGL